MSNLAILRDKELLGELKKIVSIESSNSMRATGMPPHVQQLKLLRTMRDEMISINSEFASHASTLVEAVRKAIEDNDVRSGTLNLSTLNVSLLNMFLLMLTLIANLS